MNDGRTQRRLAAILAADVVGYSRLVRSDEEGTLAALKSLRSDLIDPKIAEHHGRIVKLMGDGMLVEFGSVVEAVLAATETQQALAEHNAGLPTERRMAFRIGINLGDVVIDGDDIHGDGVNVAARLEGLADPGGLCIAGSVLEQVRDRIDVAFEDMGDQTVKNIDRPVRVFKWQPSHATTASDAAGSTTDFENRPAVAVLPFDNMSGDKEQEYFSDGLTEDLITALSHWRSFPVIARNSTFAYKGKHIDVKQLAHELGARYVLEGSVRKAGNRVRITAQLIDGNSGHHVWAEKFDRELDDIFDLQDELTQRIVATIIPELDKAEFNRSRSKRSEDLNAWDYYLRGMAFLHEVTPEGNAKARQMFEAAIEIKPDYSEAYSGLAWSYHRDILLGSTDDRMATAAKTLEASRQAVKYDDASSDAHHMLSTAFQWLNQHDAALVEARRGVELNPNLANGLHALGNKSDLAGDPDGIARMEKAQRLNPQDPQLHTHLTFLSRAYLNVGDFEAAADRARRAIQRRPDYPHAYFILAIALGHLGRAEEAQAALQKCDDLHPGFVESRRSWQPYVEPASNERLLQGLRALEVHGNRQ